MDLLPSFLTFPMSVFENFSHLFLCFFFFPHEEFQPLTSHMHCRFLSSRLFPLTGSFHPCYQETNAIHVNVGAGSYLEVNIPMTVGEEGERARRKATAGAFSFTAHLSSWTTQ